MSLKTVKKIKIIFTRLPCKKVTGFLISVFRALNRVSRFSEQVAPPTDITIRKVKNSVP